MNPRETPPTRGLVAVVWHALFASLFIFGGLSNGGNLASLHGLDENPHLFPLGRKVLRPDGGVSERLDDLELPNQELVERVNFWPCGPGYTLCKVWSPLVSDIQMVLPVSNGCLQSELTEMSDTRRFGVGFMPLSIGDPLPPTVEQDGKSTNDRSANYPRPGGEKSNGLEILLFFWGHEWWVLTLWWGFLAALILVHLDFIYGMIKEIRYFKANGELVHPLPAAAEDELGVKVQTTIDVANTAAGSGLHEADCSHTEILWGNSL
jgi:hypothetical protein